jgi:cytochrome d ubiquinol oxidase subunit I
MFVAVIIAASWFVAGISAWYFVKRRHLATARRGLSIALGTLGVIVPLQGYIGDHVAGDYVAKYKLPQLEAMEGNWDSTNTGYNVLVIPDQGGARNRWQVTIPWLGSAISKDWSGNTPTPGLKMTPKNRRPLMIPTFYGFRLMYFGWLLMLAVAMAGVILRLRGRLYTARWFHKLLVALVPIGIFAIWGGWITAETGRQPWLVNGQLLTADAVSPLKPAAVLTTLSVFVLVYIALLGTYIRYVARAVREGPADGPQTQPAVLPTRPAPRPGLVPGV